MIKNWIMVSVSCPVLSCPVAISCCAADFFLFHLSLSQKYFSQLLKQCVWDELGTAQWTTNPDAALHAYYITCTCTKCDGCTLTSKPNGAVPVQMQSTVLLRGMSHWLSQLYVATDDYGWVSLFHKWLWARKHGRLFSLLTRQGKAIPVKPY